MTPAKIARIVAAVMDVDVDSLTLGRQWPPELPVARHLWWYLWAQHARLPDAYPTRGGGRRARRDSDGAFGAIARAVGYAEASVRYGIARTEDRRDDPDFDRMVRGLELLISVSD